MRTLTALITAALLVAPAVAEAAERGKPRKPANTERQYRSTTVDHRGLCQRDNGRPSGSLNLNNRCDREEFFARFNDFGGNRR